MIELRLLRSFIAVAETEHVGQAAERLHLSQSPLSRQIQQLEDLLEVALFVRDGRRIKLTDAGRRLLDPSRDLVGRADALVRDARQGEHRIERITVGFVGTALSSGVLPRALRALRSRHPEMEIALRNLPSDGQIELLRAREIDLAVVHSLPVGRGLEVTRLLEQPYRLAVPRDHVLATQPVGPRLLGQASWIVLRTTDRARARWLAAWSTMGFVPKVAVEVADHASAVALVEAGIGVAALPASQLGSPPSGVVTRALPRFALVSALWAAHLGHPSPVTIELVADLRAASRFDEREKKPRRKRA